MPQGEPSNKQEESKEKQDTPAEVLSEAERIRSQNWGPEDLSTMAERTRGILSVLELKQNKTPEDEKRLQSLKEMVSGYDVVLKEREEKGE